MGFPPNDSSFMVTWKIPYQESSVSGMGFREIKSISLSHTHTRMHTRNYISTTNLPRLCAGHFPALGLSFLPCGRELRFGNGHPVLLPPWVDADSGGSAALSATVQLG